MGRKYTIVEIQKIRELSKRGYSQRRIAKATGVSQSYVSFVLRDLVAWIKK